MAVLSSSPADPLLLRRATDGVLTKEGDGRPPTLPLWLPLLTTRWRSLPSAGRLPLLLLPPAPLVRLMELVLLSQPCRLHRQVSPVRPCPLSTGERFSTPRVIESVLTVKFGSRSRFLIRHGWFWHRCTLPRASQGLPCWLLNKYPCPSDGQGAVLGCLSSY